MWNRFVRLFAVRTLGRSWRAYATVGGLALALGLAVRGSADSPQSPRAQPSSIQTREQSRPPIPHCEGAQAGEDASFCYSRRSTEAAEKQAGEASRANHWASKQYALSFGQVVGLLVSLLFTGWAAWAAARAAHAAEKATGVAQDTAKRQLRAYVAMDAAIARHLDGSQPLEVEMRFKNAGQTPAYKANIKGGCMLFSYPGKVELRDVSGHVYCPTVIGPGSHMVKMEHAPLPTERLASLKAGQDVLYVFGEMTYEDVFGEPRYLKYRYQIGGRQEVVIWEKDGVAMTQLAPSEEGNEAN